MPNPYFRFKQFTVYHDRCAMKVGTDGVLLGVWSNINAATKALDIGTGTGLISLMLAQRNNNLKIDAIDIDSDAIEQAKENIKISPFSTQIKCYNTSLQNFYKTRNIKYDLIISNPPFFTRSLKSPDHNRSLARHTDSLAAEELLNISSFLLHEQGRLSLIYPHDCKENLIAEAEKHFLYPLHITDVYPTPNSIPRRILIEFTKMKSPAFIQDSLVIETERHVYSEEFIKLAKEFYLKL